MTAKLALSSRVFFFARGALVIGSVLVVAGIVLSIRALDFRRRAQPAIATVVETGSRRLQQPRGTTVYDATVRYTDSHGTVHTGLITSQSVYRVGTKVTILHDPQRPGRVSRPGFWNIHGGSLIALGLGGWMLLMGLVLKRAANRVLAGTKTKEV